MNITKVKELVEESFIQHVSGEIITWNESNFSPNKSAHLDFIFFQKMDAYAGMPATRLSTSVVIHADRKSPEIVKKVVISTVMTNSPVV